MSDSPAAILYDSTGTEKGVHANPVIVQQQRTSSATVTAVAVSTSTVTLLAANPARVGCTVFNDAKKDLWIKLGAGASGSDFTVLLPQNAYYEMPFGYTGVVTGRWSGAATGFARVTEVTV